MIEGASYALGGLRPRRASRVLSQTMLPLTIREEPIRAAKPCHSTTHVSEYGGLKGVGML
jgi:hypothetical protein